MVFTLLSVRLSVFPCSGLVNTALLLFEHFSEGEWLVSGSGTLIELAHELDPMKTHGVQEDLKRVHHEEHSEDSEHEAETGEEEV